MSGARRPAIDGLLVLCVAMAGELDIIDIGRWIEENKSSFVPPVCNKLM